MTPPSRPDRWETTVPNLTETAAGLVAPRGRITLTRHTIEQEHRHLDSTGDFSGLLNAIATAVKIIANQVNRGGLAAPADRLARASNEVMTAETLWGGHLAATASAASGGIVAVPAPYRRGKYLLAYSPLDGSDGIDVNQSAGTIFSVLRTPARAPIRESRTSCNPAPNRSARGSPCTG
nr:hypothetical protein GCM10020092_066800 [Actinoplanes digitatis]